MGWLIALGILTLIAIVPVGASVLYDGTGPRAFLIAGPFRVCFYPKKKRTKKEKVNSVEEVDIEKDIYFCFEFYRIK